MWLFIGIDIVEALIYYSTMSGWVDKTLRAKSTTYPLSPSSAA